MGVSLTREAALRLGMTARALTGVSIAQLVDGLVKEIGWPVDEEKLSRVTVTQLRNALAQGGSIDADPDLPSADVATRFSLESLKRAVEILWGERTVDLEAPPIEPYEDGDMPGSVRVAVASDLGENLNAHFGSAHRYLIYQISVGEIRLIDVRSAEGACDADDPSAYRVGIIRDCHILLVQSVGGPAAAKVINAGIYPLKYPEGGPARPYIEALQLKMGSAPPPWLAKAMDVPVEDRIRIRVEVDA